MPKKSNRKTINELKLNIEDNIKNLQSRVKNHHLFAFLRSNLQVITRQDKDEIIPQIFTVGYVNHDRTESIGWEEFINTLKEHNVEVIFDLRLNRKSPIPFFDARKIRRAMRAQNIVYLWTTHLTIHPEDERAMMNDNEKGKARRKFIEKIRENSAAIEAFTEYVENKVNICFLERAAKKEERFGKLLALKIRKKHQCEIIDLCCRE